MQRQKGVITEEWQKQFVGLDNDEEGEEASESDGKEEGNVLDYQQLPTTEIVI